MSPLFKTSGFRFGPGGGSDIDIVFAEMGSMSLGQDGVHRPCFFFSLLCGGVCVVVRRRMMMEASVARRGPGEFYLGVDVLMTWVLVTQANVNHGRIGLLNSFSPVGGERSIALAFPT